MHGPPDAERDYSLTADEQKRSKKSASERAASLKQCLTDAAGPGCYRIYPSTLTACPGCGKVAAGGKKIREVDADAVPLSELDAVPREEKRGEWDRLMGVARASGYRDKWCSVAFKSKFKHWPPWKWTQEAKRRFEHDPDWQGSYVRRLAGARA